MNPEDSVTANTSEPGAPPVAAAERLGRIVLAGLLLAALVGALTLDREHRPLVGDEATFAMQAESIAFDLDLRYTRADYDRFVRLWQRPPDGLILQTTDAGRTLTYGKPALYAFAIAPFVRASPLRGAQVANVFFLALAAVFVGRALRPSLGPAVPWWVACWLFASVTFAYFSWEHAEIFLVACTACGFALVYGVGEAAPGNPRRDLLRFAVAGALIGAVAASRLFYLALLLPLVLAVPAPRRRSRRGALLGGAVLLLALAAVGRIAAGGDWTGYGAERRGFYPRTGYPEVEFPASEWPQMLVKLGNTSWTQEGAIPWNLSPRLWAYDAWYFLVGRNVGVLPYFLPLLLGLTAFRAGRGRWAIPLAVALAMGGFVLVRPHNFFGGVGALADRYFLPLYPALWFLAGRRGRVSAALLVTACAAPFLLPLWSAPRLFPVGENGRYAFVSRAAAWLLPYETTLSHVPGGQDIGLSGLWVRFLNDGAGRDADAPWLRVGEDAELLIGNPAPLSELRIDLRPALPTGLEVGGAARRSPENRNPPGEFTIALGRPTAVHPMWWTEHNYNLYRVRLRLPAGDGAAMGTKLPLRILPAVSDPGF